jgi:hypothetical protein
MTDNPPEDGQLSNNNNNIVKQRRQFRIEILPRKRTQSLTERIVGHSREWIQSFYPAGHENGNMSPTDSEHRDGFNDQADDFVPSAVSNTGIIRRRRTSSLTSDSSIDSLDDSPVAARPRAGSISERVAGMQLQRKPKSILEGYAVTNATVLDDQT